MFSLKSMTKLEDLTMTKLEDLTVLAWGKIFMQMFFCLSSKIHRICIFQVHVHVLTLFTFFCPQRKDYCLVYLLKLPCRYSNKSTQVFLFSKYCARMLYLFQWNLMILWSILQTIFLHFIVKFVQQCSDEEMGEIGGFGKSRILYLPRPMTRTACRPGWLVAYC